MTSIPAVSIPPLEPSFIPAARWNRNYHHLVTQDKGARPLTIALLRPDGTVLRHETRVLSDSHPHALQTTQYAERLLKFLLWQQGGSRVLLAGADEVGRRLARLYRPRGKRAFDSTFMGRKVYGAAFAVDTVRMEDVPASHEAGFTLGRHLDGCRIGFDLGGSDRKVAALIDGKVVFSEETRWDPYFQNDPSYHLNGIQESLERAAAHLPRVDAIGGSSAGVYVNNEVRVASLFRGVSPARFERDVRHMFLVLRERWGGIPFEVANDGEVTALAGSMALNEGAVLGLSMGTSQAGGYVRGSGEITTWLNELAFAPINFAPDAPVDEWSGDIGCGVQYFSQQGVSRLAHLAGMAFPPEVALPERLVAVQDALERGDTRAVQIFTTIGRCFGHALAHYADHYEIRHVLVLGRVTSGTAGSIILDEARTVLRTEYGPLGDLLTISMPDEQTKRHGQAIAAASLPALSNL
ncbi:ROK family protein [Oleiharenicola lentus]|uniref:ROK family protein n=1 Tax=Oleiharenicola lentus TaxID=2508720 RepID=A0A4Q1C4X8_9BACT|nr:ROK family protein [Oleiharenicola lentus]RXK53494.1 ROK family protein [Oleiharenicola lentus]